MDTLTILERPVKKWRNVAVTSAALLSLAYISGCGVSSTPSESDAEKQINAVFKDCEIIKVSDFTKINGVQQSDGSYNVSTKFQLHATPLQENIDKLKEVEARHKELEPKFNEYKTKLAEMQGKAKDLEPGLDKLPFESERYNALLSKIIDLNREAEQYSRANSSLIVEYGRYDPSPRGNVSALHSNFMAKCHYPKTNLTRSLVNQLIDSPQAFVQKVDKEFSVTFNMIKTDNGWMIHNLWQ